MSGKGSARRNEDRAAVEANWDRIKWTPSAPGSDAGNFRAYPARDEPEIVQDDEPSWHSKGL